MDTAELFARTVASLPEAAKRRLDGDAPLDWAVLEDPRTGVDVAEAARAHRRLPGAAETLVERLIGDVGIVPADVVAAMEREGAANAWLRRVAIEPDGESYRLRNEPTGETCAGIPPEALAGYATLALDLIAAVHEASERWVEAGDRFGPAVGTGLSLLARCAIRMGSRLRAMAETGPRLRPTGSLAQALEDGWNSQSLSDRAELSTAIRLSTARGACAPRQCHFAPLNGYRAHGCDLAEVRWLGALAERAMRGAPAYDGERASAGADPETTVSATAEEEALAAEIGRLTARADRGAEPPFAPPPDADPDEYALSRELADLRRVADRHPAGEGAVAPVRTGAQASAGKDVASLDMTALEAQIWAETTDAFELGSDPGELTLDGQLASILHAARRLPDPLKRRLGELHGVGAEQALARLRDPRDADVMGAELQAAAAGGPVPRWLEDLAGALLADAGACTRGGLRTGSLCIDPEGGSHGGYVVTELRTGAQASLTLLGLIEQTHQGLGFVHDASVGLTTLENAGKEAGWTLTEGVGANIRLAGIERETLEAATHIERTIGRIRDTCSHLHRAPSAIEQASIVADALTTVGPTVRAAAGWPGAVGPPDPRNPGHVARVAEVAETLHGDIKSISNRLIAGRMAVAATYEDQREA